MYSQEKHPVAIIGGGPVGLAAAAHLIERGESFVLFEAGDSIGANILTWGHVRLFSPWRYCTDKAATALLQRHGWQHPPLTELPTGQDLVEQYLQPLARLPELSPTIHYNSRVIAVGRRGLDKMKTADRDNQPFVVQVEQAGQRKSFLARAVIDASGNWHNPNPIGSGGIAAQGESAAKKHIFYGIPDVSGLHRERYVGKRVMVVGSGHSAINAVLDLVKLKESKPDTQIVWALRKAQLKQAYGGETDDALPARGALGTQMRAVVEARQVEVIAPFHIERIAQSNGALTITGHLAGSEKSIEAVDEIIVNTGSRPELDFLREVRYSIDPSLESVPALAPLIDPNVHSCGTVRPHGEGELRQPEENFYIVGVKSYGRAPTFLLATGYEQVRSVVAALTGDWIAAAQVQLDLPETGVCSTDFAVQAEASAVVAEAEAVVAACCG